MLRSGLCDYSDVYIVIKGITIVEWNNVAKIRNKTLTFKNNAPFTDTAEHLAPVPMYNLLECSENYSMTSGGLWNYYRDKINHAANENNAARTMENYNKTITSKPFEFEEN